MCEKLHAPHDSTGLRATFSSNKLKGLFSVRRHQSLTRLRNLWPTHFFLQHCFHSLVFEGMSLRTALYKVPSQHFNHVEVWILTGPSQQLDSFFFLDILLQICCCSCDLCPVAFCFRWTCLDVHICEEWQPTWMFPLVNTFFHCRPMTFNSLEMTL